MTNHDDGRDHGDWDDADDQLAESTGNYSAIIDAFDSYTVTSQDDSTLDELDLDTDVKRFADDGDDLDALNALDVPDAAIEEDDLTIVTVMNPPGTVTVTTNLAGAVQQIELGPTVTSSTELELANEIRAVADAASKKATSVMHVISVELLAAQGLDRDTAADLISEHAPFASPDQARAAEANLLARYNGTAD